MCDPVSASFAIAATTTAIGGVQQANSQRAAGKANQQYYDYVSEQNNRSADAALAAGETKANLEQFKGSQDAAKYDREAGAFRSYQRAAGAAMGSGGATAEDIATDSLNKEKLDQMAIRYNADLASWSAKTGADYEAWDYRNQSSLNKIAGTNARKAGNAQATATLIGTATSVASSAYDFSKYNSNPVRIR